MKIGFPRRFRIAGVSAIALAAFLALAPSLVQKTKAFTLVELQIQLPLIAINELDQILEVAVHNTYGAEDMHATISWGDGCSGNAIGTPAGGDMSPGHGVVVLLPAVQSGTGSNCNGATLPYLEVVPRVTLTPGPGAKILPQGVERQVSVTLHVINKNTHDVILALPPTGNVLVH